MEINCKTVLIASALFSLVLLVCATDAVNPERDVHVLSEDPPEIVGEALQCFHYVDICKPELRLSPNGSLHVPRDETNEYYNGGCYQQTQLVLTCIDQILYNFEFDDGASIDDVRKTITAICTKADKSGDFNKVWESTDSTSHAKRLIANISSLTIFVAFCGLLYVISQIMV